MAEADNGLFRICLQNIFNFLLLMCARNIKSIEQLKNVNQREAGLILGLKKLPHRKVFWQWFYAACNRRFSTSLCKSFFKQQLLSGVVSAYMWFADGHLLPYTGKQKVHPAFNTQRKMMMPGQTNIVTCDASGRIVDFQIQEGKNLFDFVTASLWNVRKDMTDWVLCHYPNENEYVDLFYAIT